MSGRHIPSMVKEVSQSLTLYALPVTVLSKTPDPWKFELPVIAGSALNIHLVYTGESAQRKLCRRIARTASTAIAVGRFVGFALGFR